MRGSTQNVRDESGAPDPHVFEIGGFASAVATEPMQLPATPYVPAILPVQQTTPTVLPPAPPSTEQPLSARQLVAQLRARLRIVEREIKLRAALEAERVQIKRLIAAAKIERNNVRAIRSAG